MNNMNSLLLKSVVNEVYKLKAEVAEIKNEIKKIKSVLDNTRINTINREPIRLPLNEENLQYLDKIADELYLSSDASSVCSEK